MADLSVTEAVNRAQEAIEAGNYDGAIDTCHRILGEFPEFAMAHRLLGEALLEQGQVEDAKDAFRRTLERDPQSIPAHIGLGRIAEQGGDTTAALAHYQVAWEIDPRQRELREHVGRISQQVYGQEGRLFLTRAALSSLHFHAGRWDRAITEAAAVLQEHDTRIDVQVRMAESLWRRGDDANAMQVCSTVLRTLPVAVVPLLIQADIHRRNGNQGEAEAMLERARSIDPDGVRAADLILVGGDDQADFLIVEDVPTIDERVFSEEPSRRQMIAPDFISEEPAQPKPPPTPAPPPEPDPSAPIEDLPDPAASAAAQPEADLGDLQPFRWEDLGEDIDLESSDLPGGENPAQAASSADEGTDSLELYTDEELESFRPGEIQPRGFTGMLQDLEDEGMQPFDPFGDQPASGQRSQQQQPPQQAQPSESQGQSEDEIDLDSFELYSDEEIDGFRPGEEHPRGFTGMMKSLEDEGMQPFDPFGDQAASGQGSQQPEAADEPTEEIDLDSFELYSDEEIEGFRPGEEQPRGFTGMLQDLEDEGMQPFDPTGASGEPQGQDAQPTQPSASSEPAKDDDPFNLDWDGIENEIEEARPGELPRGYTDQLRKLNASGVQPFSFDDDSALGADDFSFENDVDVSDSERVDSDDPFAFDDSADLDSFELPSAQESTPSDDAGLEDLPDDWWRVDAQSEGADETRSLPDQLPTEPVDPTGDLEELFRAGEWSSYEGATASTEPDATFDSLFDDDAWGEDIEHFETDDSVVETNHTGGGDTDELDLPWDIVGESPAAEAPPPGTSPLELSEEIRARLEEIGESPDEIDQLVDEGQFQALAESPDPSEVFGADDDADDPFAGWNIDETMDDETPTAELESSWQAETEEESVSSEPEPEPESMVEREVAAEPANAQQPSEPEVTPDQVIHEAPSSLEDVAMSIERIGLSASLLDRVRERKDALVHEGLIEGRARLPGMGPSIPELEAMISAEPGNVDHRIALGAALTESEPKRSLEEFRWVYRYARERVDDVLPEVRNLADLGGDAEPGAHRLLGAIYRQAGDWRSAAGHYEEALLRSGRS